MEVRGQEINDVRMSGGSSGGAGGGRRDGNHNGTTTNFLTYTTQQQHQTLDHHHRAGPAAGGGSNSSSKPPPPAVRYRECLRNHAANVGGNVYDGCGEFMPGGEEGSLEALKCAACDCHRNFHRKEIDGETVPVPAVGNHHIFSPGSRRSGGGGGGGGHLVHALQLPAALPSPVMHHHHPHPHHHHHHHQRYLHSSSPPAVVQPMSVAFGGGSAATESSSEDLNAFPNSSDMGTVGMMGGISPHPPQYGMSKKRFRTKFTAEQKERMMEFAEKVGWRINKQDEEAVERFCSEVGVKRQVFKVWMHNNKNVRKQMTTEEDHHHHLNHHHQMRAEDGGDNGQQQQQQQRGEGML
ncbi:Zinc-finger homeodomain protein 5 [Linum grandiflorum]